MLFCQPVENPKLTEPVNAIIFYSYITYSFRYTVPVSDRETDNIFWSIMLRIPVFSSVVY